MDQQKSDLTKMTVGQFADAVAAKTPTPGGGSVAGVVAALGVALGQMSLNFTIGKKKFAAQAEFHQHLAGRLDRARAMCNQFVADDVAAYEFFSQTSKLPDGDEKENTLQLALSASVNIPRQLTKLALAIMEDLLSLADKCNVYLLSDLMAGAVLAAAAAKLSHYNVEVNVPSLTDRQAASQVLAASQADVARAAALLDEIETLCRKVRGTEV